MTKRLYSQPGIVIRPNIWDALSFLLVASLISLLMFAAGKMALPFHLGEPIAISLAVQNLPFYALQTVFRMFIALALSFLFSLIIGTLAAKSERAGSILIPVIDILQSVPILGYLSITVMAFIALFPNSLLGPQCAAIFAVFTSQVWNMTLSFYQSLRTVPQDLIEATEVYQLSPWQRFWRLDVPFATPGLLWNAMMSMSGGWFFIVASEAISIANQTITLPGIGSYIALAISTQNWQAIVYAIATMLIVIIIYDQLLFRPLIAWSQKFRNSDLSQDDESESWVLNLLSRTRALQKVGDGFNRLINAFINLPFLQGRTSLARHRELPLASRLLHNFMWYGLLLILFGSTTFLIWHGIYRHIPFRQTWDVIILGSFTALRVFTLIMLCSLIWVPVGIKIGLNPKLSRTIQPIAQFLAAFPANLFFPIFVVLILTYHLNVEIWTAPLMVLGTQWYILFNVIAGANSIPRELKLAAQNMQLSGWLKWRRFLLPAIFPFYVTGAITAAGGSWNASVVAEIINWGHVTLRAHGLGAYITQMTTEGKFSEIALGVVVMCFWVMMINLLFWRRLYHFARERYQF